MTYNRSMELKENEGNIDEGFLVAAAVPALPFEYDENDSRVMDTIDLVAEFCGYEFTEVPQDPDEEPGVPMPLDDENGTPIEGEDEGEGEGEETDPEEPEEPKEDEEEGEPDPAEPDKPGEPYPEFDTDELDKLREEYKKAKEENYQERKSYWAKLWQVIRFISTITCWTEDADDTFFTQVRKQVYTVEQTSACRPNCCGCDPDQIVIPLDYYPLYCDGPFVKGWITVFINGKPVREEIPYDYLCQHYDPSTGKVWIMRDDFPDTLLYRGGLCCLCRRKCSITILYNAGYESLPAGLLPILCPLMSKIDESKMGMSDCANAMTKVAGYLKFKKVGNIQYQWSDTDTEQSKTLALMTELYNLATVNEVMALSRCMLAEMPEEIGDVI